MIIYLITNKINNKKYVGQTIGTIEDRFHRHMVDSYHLNTKFANAIRKYGAKNFDIEVLEECGSKEELNDREIYWIDTLKTFTDGYNSTLGGDGGDTYSARTEEQMEETKAKIRLSKLGGKNPAARAVKALNVDTGKEVYFNSLAEMRDFFGEKHHKFISQRAKGEIRYLYKGIWNIAYADADYFPMTKTKNIARSIRALIKNNETGEEKEFNSFAEGGRYWNLSKGYFTNRRPKDKKTWTKGVFTITILD